MHSFLLMMLEMTEHVWIQSHSQSSSNAPVVHLFDTLISTPRAQLEDAFVSEQPYITNLKLAQCENNSLTWSSVNKVINNDNTSLFYLCTMLPFNLDNDKAAKAIYVREFVHSALCVTFVFTEK